MLRYSTSKEIYFKPLKVPFYSIQMCIFPPLDIRFDRLCGLLDRVSGYRYRGLGFDSRRYQIF